MFTLYRLSIFGAAFIITALLFLASPENGFSQGGCCRTPDNLSCLGCVSGCASTESYCDARGGIFIGVTDACVSEFGDCGDLPPATTGCCQVEAGSCMESRTYDQCFGADNGNFWLAGESCTALPQCGLAQIPTMSEWGLIALAGVLGAALLFFIRRKRAAA